MRGQIHRKGHIYTEKNSQGLFLQEKENDSVAATHVLVSDFELLRFTSLKGVTHTLASF